MNREPFQKLFESKGMTFQRAKYVRGFPRLSGAVASEQNAAELIGTPGHMRAVNIISQWNTPEDISAAMDLVHETAKIVFPEAQQQIYDQIQTDKIQPGFNETVALSGDGRRNLIMQCAKITNEITVVFSSFNML